MNTQSNGPESVSFDAIMLCRPNNDINIMEEYSRDPKKTKIYLLMY